MKKLVSKRNVLITLILAMSTLSGCADEGSQGAFLWQRLQWSPDGSRALVIDSDSRRITDRVRVADRKGALSDVISAAKPLDWMPHSQTFLAVTSDEVKTWDDLKGLLIKEEEDEQRVIAAARLCAKLAATGKTLGTLTESEQAKWDKATADMNCDHIYLYLKSTDPDTLKKWSGGSDNMADPVKADSLRLYNVSPELDKTGQILFRDPFVIQQLAVSPRGEAVAVVIGFGARSRMVLISTKQPTQKPPVSLVSDVSGVDWYDNENLVFIKTKSTSKGDTGELTMSTVLDSYGNPVNKPKQRVLARADLDDFSTVQCTSNGIFFYSPAKATDGTESAIEHKLLKVIPDEKPVVMPILPDQFNIPGASKNFRISPDGKHIAVLQQNGTVDVLDTAGGATLVAQGDAFEESQYYQSCFTPEWVTSDALSFSAPKKTANSQRAAEIMLWSLSSKKITELSSNWPPDTAQFLNVSKNSSSAPMSKISVVKRLATNLEFLPLLAIEPPMFQD